ATKEDQTMHKIIQTEINKSTDSANLDKGLVLEPKIVDRLQKNQEMITNNKAMLPKSNRTKISQEHLESELTDELAIKVYGSQLLPYTQSDQRLVTTELRTFKHEQMI
ncbi:119_t:CDS:1, partial [Gigaspora margarita]